MSLLQSLRALSRNRTASITLAVTALLAPRLASAQGDMAGVDKSQAALMTQIYNEALQAFQRGEWGPAASGLAKLIAMVSNEGQAQIAPAYLTMGAAYYLSLIHI